MPIWTAQYRYAGPDRLDITVKGQDKLGKILAPTWDMVKAYKNNPVNYQSIYVEEYYRLITNRYKQLGERSLLLQIVERATTQGITLVCFCPAGAFCHRTLAAHWLNQCFDSEIFNTIYKGER